MHLESGRCVFYVCGYVYLEGVSFLWRMIYYSTSRLSEVNHTPESIVDSLGNYLARMNRMIKTSHVIDACHRSHQLVAPHLSSHPYQPAARHPVHPSITFPGFILRCSDEYLALPTATFVHQARPSHPLKSPLSSRSTTAILVTASTCEFHLV